MGEESLGQRFAALRGRTLDLTRGLTAEDQQISAFEYASPTKWHLGHTTWFFETFILKDFCAGYRDFDPAFAQLFNSYYESLGTPFTRAQRGALSRPALLRVLEYRRSVENQVLELLGRPLPEDQRNEIESRLRLGLAHEEQHQELMVTDILANFSVHPELPAAWRQTATKAFENAAPSEQWLEFAGGMAQIGARAEEGSDLFYFDHEGPLHEVKLAPFALCCDLVSNAQVIAFIEAGGYQNPRWWLSDGIDWVRKYKVSAPRYWRQKDDGQWWQFSLHGERLLCPHAPVCHLSGFEADAIASWLGARLPTEFEWEFAARAQSRGPECGRWISGDSDAGNEDSETPVSIVPRVVVDTEGGLRSLWGEVWEWTRSSLLPYPGYRASESSLGEYNGKFMNGQWVLRGGSCATPPGHMRASYRNFFYPHQRWQFCGLRLARDLSNEGGRMA